MKLNDFNQCLLGIVKLSKDETLKKLKENPYFFKYGNVFTFNRDAVIRDFYHEGTITNRVPQQTPEYLSSIIVSCLEHFPKQSSVIYDHSGIGPIFLAFVFRELLV